MTLKTRPKEQVKPLQRWSFIFPIIICSLLVSLWIYSRYFTNFTFGDEYDNFTYSWLFRLGYVPYKDFFTHHFPFLIFLGAPIEFFFHSQSAYRTLTLFAYFGFFLFSIYYLKGFWRGVICTFMVFSSFAISLYSGHQYVDATYVSIFTLSAFFIILKSGSKSLSKMESFIFALLFTLTLFVSPVHFLAFGMLALFHFYNQRAHQRLDWKTNFRNLKIMLLTAAVIIFVFIIYLFYSNSISDFYFAAFTFNNNFAYYHFYEPYINFKFLDFYLHTTRDVINHFYELTIKEGSYFLQFLRSFKYIVFPFAVGGDYFNFLRVVLSELYNNFFSFEIFIALFYVIGSLSLFLNKKKALAIFSLIFIFGVRLRINDRIHMAEYYLFSYWLISTAVVVATSKAKNGERVFSNLIILTVSMVIMSLFVIKNLPDFEQVAFNRYPKLNSQTVELIKKTSNSNEKILMLPFPGDSSYYYDSRRQPYGFFVNYFEWYNNSQKLRSRWLADIKNYKGDFLIVPKEGLSLYCSRKEKDWVRETFVIVDSSYIMSGSPDQNYIFRKRGDQQFLDCRSN